MNEPSSNIGLVCKDCAEHRLSPNPMFFELIPSSLIGRYCKLAFPCRDGRNEYMWVLVTGLGEKEELVGTLNNSPLIFDADCGDVFEFNRSEIIDVIGNGEN
jgi:hypothetical protein